MNLDHVVIVVTDLERAMTDYQALGFTVLPGGEHADGRTHNALIAFADGTYIELIAFRSGVVGRDHPWWRFATAGGGLADWALATDRIDERVQVLHDAGLAFEDLGMAAGCVRTAYSFDGGRPSPHRSMGCRS